MRSWARLSMAVAALAMLVAVEAEFSHEAGAVLETTTITVVPDVDTFVDVSRPTTTFGSTTSLSVDGSPETVSYLRFTVTGLTGWDVSRIRLRAYNKNASPVGGVVRQVSSVTWPEDLLWADRPAIDGATLGTFGAVAVGSWYELDLQPFLTADGTVSIAITSTNGDGASWASRLTATPPVLVIDASREVVREPAARISIGPSALATVGSWHQLTATVEVDDGTGWVPAPLGSQIDLTITDGPGSLGASGCTVTDTSGSCGVALTSSDPGTTTVSATSTVDVAGTTRAVSTDGTGGSSSPALVRWTAPGATRTITLAPAADTHVDASRPTTAFGTSSTLSVDGSPQVVSYLRFDLADIGEWDVVAARLRMFNRNASPSGGDVRSVSDSTWAESLTWNTRPAVDGPVLGSFGAVTTSQWFTAELTPPAAGSSLALAVVSSDGDAAGWAARSTTTPPELVLELAPRVAVPGEVDRLGVAVPGSIGSSDPTTYAGNDRSVVTAGGRILSVVGRHQQGLQLVWRDRGLPWQTRTTGTVTDGRLLSGTGTGDWTASIVTASDSAGAEHAWVVWAGMSMGSVRPMSLVRLSDLDAADGPTVGTPVVADTAATARADLAVDTVADRLAVVWTRRADSTTYVVTAGWVTDLDDPTPDVVARSAIHTSSTPSRGAVVMVDAGGTAHLVARTVSNRLRIHRHLPGAPLDAWPIGAAVGVAGTTGSFPAGRVLPDGSVLAVVDSASGAVVQRFAPDGSSVTTELASTDLRQVSLVGDDTRTIAIGVRPSDGAVVSIVRDASGAWGSTTVEIAPGSAGAGLAWPNPVVALDGRLRILVRSAGDDSNRSIVWWFQRPV